MLRRRMMINKNKVYDFVEGGITNANGGYLNTNSVIEKGFIYRLFLRRAPKELKRNSFLLGSGGYFSKVRKGFEVYNYSETNNYYANSGYTDTIFETDYIEPITTKIHCLEFDCSLNVLRVIKDDYVRTETFNTLYPSEQNICLFAINREGSPWSSDDNYAISQFQVVNRDGIIVKNIRAIYDKGKVKFVDIISDKEYPNSKGLDFTLPNW